MCEFCFSHFRMIFSHMISKAHNCVVCQCLCILLEPFKKKNAYFYRGMELKDAYFSELFRIKKHVIKWKIHTLQECMIVNKAIKTTAVKVSKTFTAVTL